MAKETDIVFALLRSALDGQPPCIDTRSVETGTWWRLFRLLQTNHVTALTAETVAALEVPREVKIPWLAESDKAERWHCYQKEVQQDIVDTMARHGIETLVLKGTHTAQYYPQPEQREFGDLDLYFYDRHKEADRVAHEVLKVVVSNDSHHHSKYDYRGVTVESHYDFLNRHYPPSNRRYEAVLKGLAPSATFEILFQLRHLAGHFAASRITLRDLVDWALTCRALRDKADWPLVQTTAAQYGMEPFARLLCSIAERRFGIQPPESFKGTPVDSEEVDRMEHDILYGTVNDLPVDGPARLGWKIRRWKALGWKRRLVYNDPDFSLWLASLTSHAAKPHSILHKM